MTLYPTLFKAQQEELDFILIRQKDRIIRLINNGKYSEATQALNVVSELWTDCNYEYKWRELTQRIQESRLSKM